ncbi:18642_t:CDS:2 [Funneliformis geosporum]|uniref:15791_t:CDS:1 n=1 Tax=Funneliformis geosporum TaxID=1117311 RepID=A0A9W4SP87_9GLOM|nr:18642_t:CDS:2 [Funneliformis geosporum]CAI2176298.1 15791_t:CDS:2 [Funneliformis geosporum]
MESHNTKRYSLPTEEEYEEFNQVQSRHYVLRYTWQANFSAPVHEKLLSGVKVLDIACGPGYWILDMASKYPKSEFTGVDKISFFPSELKPPNANFEKGDAFCLPYEEGTFDFIRMSLMSSIFSAEDWKNTILPDVLRMLKPGGYFESQEFDWNMINLGPCFGKLTNGFIQYLEINNIDKFICSNMEKYLRETNFIEINSIDVECRFWDGRYGRLVLDDFILSYKRIMLNFCNIIGIDEDQCFNLLSNLEEEVIDYKSSYKLYRFFGRKSF